MGAVVIAIALALLVAVPVHAQTNATLQGRVFDASGAVVPRASISVLSSASGFRRSVESDSEGRYQLPGIPAGSYEVSVTATGFRSEVIEELRVEVGRTLVRDFRLEIGRSSETVVVEGEIPLIERASTSVGHVVTAETVQQIPLNGRRFTDLGLLVPGSVAPSQTGFSTTPIRGVGALAINTAGNREEAVGYIVNGVTTNNLTFGSLSFQPSIASIQEFSVNNSAFTAEYGHVSGAIVNIVTRSGTDDFRGELFEFYRDERFDARNFFEFNSPEPHPFERNQFGGSLGGPLMRGRTFFFMTYEGLRQRQGLDVNSLVLSDQQRSAATDPVVRQLVQFIPRANVVDASGTSRYVGAAAAVVDTDRWTIDLQQNVGTADRWHLFFGTNHINALEPMSQGTTIPGFGHSSNSGGSILTIGYTHVARRFLNEARFGRSALYGTIVPASAMNPADYGIGNGVTRAIGLPQFSVAGGLTFGGPANYPQGRTDASYLVTDTLHMMRGRHTFRLGGEYRHFLNENFLEGTGLFNFPSVNAFLTGTANAFSITLGERRNHISQRALGMFVQDSITVRSNVTLELGVRYEWHVTPTERDNQFVVFDAPSVALLRVGVDVDEIYRQNDTNFEPRAGIVWDATRDGRTVVRAAYALAADEPGTTAVRDTAANPPFAMPLTAAGSITLADALGTTRPGGLAPATIDHNF
ncbi:MAG TPA: TonB-dependent receptor, partial [Vicinamibacterales bacterium]|nr:TonB-dependent receptor [Vicinamibacterales bacterium]